MGYIRKEASGFTSQEVSYCRVASIKFFRNEITQLTFLSVIKKGE